MRKLLVWDLDGTIWKETFLEAEELTLREGIVDVIKGLDERGILQSIISRNPPEVRLKLKDFGLLDYFVFPQINWSFKPYNMQKILDSLHILPKDVAFIDDNKRELIAMQTSYKDILCLDAKEYKNLLEHPEFKVEYITEASKKRRMFFKAEEERLANKPMMSHEEFLKHLEMKISIKRATESDKNRVLELFNRTNRLNATGMRYTDDEIRQYDIIVCYASDKYGDYGLIGACLLNKTNHSVIEGLTVSCRALDRGVIQSLLSVLSPPLNIRVIETKYNDKLRNTLEMFGAEKGGKYWKIKNIKKPDWVMIDAGI